MNAYVALLAGFAAFVVWRSLYRDFMAGPRQINRDLARRPPTQIADITEGPVRVIGRARAIGERLTAPVTGRPCVAFHLKIERKWGNHSWDTVVEDREVPPFAIVDETGQAIVDPTGSLALALVPDAYGSDALLALHGKEQHVYVARQLARDRVGELGFAANIRFEEGIIEVGELIAIGGLAEREPAPEGERPTPRAAPERLVLRGTPDEPLAISDWPEATRPPPPVD
jgi:hypothetical protein